MFDALRQDVRYATRLAIKDRGFTLATTTTLALCLAANVAIFAIVNAVLLRQLPYPDADRLVTMFNAYPKAGVMEGANTVPDYFDRREERDAFSDLALYTWTGVTIGGGGQGEAERMLGMTVTPSFFRTLRVQPVSGRVFIDVDGDVGQEKKVIVSQRLWQNRFPGRSAVAGADLRINGVPYSVVGVVADSFRFDPDVQLWMPAAFSPEDRADSQRTSNQWMMLGRLAPGVTLVQAQQRIDALNARNLERFPELKQILINAGFHTPVLLLRDQIVRDARPVILLLWEGVLLLLVIGCVNVVNLAAVRATTRLREIATRLALGSTISRLMRQTITESLLVSLAGGVAGVLLAAWSLRAIDVIGIETLPRRTEIAIDGRVIGYAFALVGLVGLLVGLWPTLALRRASLAQSIHEEGRSGTTSRRARAMRRVLVTSQVALAMMLLMGSGLLVRSFQRVLTVDLGFKVDRVLTGDVNLPASRYPRDPEMVSAADRILQALRTVPGIDVAGLTTSIPFGKTYSNSVIVPEGHAMEPGESVVSPGQIKVTDDYFDAMGVSLLAGRFIDSRDALGAPRVLLVDDRLAKKFWPGVNPIGRRVYFPAGGSTGLAPPPENEWLTVVGVVKEMRVRGIVSDSGPGALGTFFVPYRQSPERHVTLAMRTQQAPADAIKAVRTAIARIDSDLAFYDVRPMGLLVDRELIDRRTTMLLALGFASVALLLCGIGIYGILAFDVRQRTREIAIRIALGADRARIVAMVLTHGTFIAVTGVALGLGTALLLRRTLESQLYEVVPSDPGVMTAVASVVFAVAIVACVLPVRRAARVDPMTALRAE